VAGDGATLAGRAQPDAGGGWPGRVDRIDVEERAHPGQCTLPAMFDVAVVGAGIVGLATAREVLRRRPGAGVVILDKEDRVGAHQTGRNSGVIHAGLYYRPGSLKARTCRRGVELLLRFLEEQDVRHELCGKVVVATSEEELPRLEDLLRRGIANGVPGLVRIGPKRLHELEPHAAGIAALHSPGTGIVDFGEVARAMATDAQRGGAELRLGHEVRALAMTREGVVLETGGGPVAAKSCVLCGGLHADRLARLAGPARLVGTDGEDAGPAPDVRLVPFRGEYHALTEAARGLVRNLIYPVPDPGFPFLGVHFTRRIDGTVEAGPNAVLALKREGYRKTDLDAADAWSALAFPGFWRLARRTWRTGAAEMARSFSRELFARALLRLVPEIRPEHLAPGGTGVRAQALVADGGLLDDFLITRSPRVVSVLNAPSPAATASLAIAERVVDAVPGLGGEAGAP
jgi:L-2-hydroxyglutarate oxidase LhgO